MTDVGELPSKPQSERLARVEITLEAMTEGITEIKTILRSTSAPMQR